MNNESLKDFRHSSTPSDRMFTKLFPLLWIANKYMASSDKDHYFDIEKNKLHGSAFEM